MNALCWNRSVPSVDNWISAPLSGRMPDFQVAAVFAQHLGGGRHPEEAHLKLFASTLQDGEVR